MNLMINGELREFTDVSTVRDLLNHFQIVNKIVVVELNLEIIERDSYDGTLIKENDRIEIVHFVGGG